MHRLGHRQERWLHTRISEGLDEALRREARRRRSPVSLVVRNVLESALELVEDIVGDSLKVARRSRDLAHGPERVVSSDDVYGWQAIILNRSATCGHCNAMLATGADAHRGLRDRPGPPVFLCSTCVRRLRRPAAQQQEGSR